MTDTDPRAQGAQTSGLPTGPGPEHRYGYGDGQRPSAPHGYGPTVPSQPAAESRPDAGYRPGTGYGPGPGAPTGTPPPPPQDGPPTGSGGGRRRGRPLVLASAALAALLVAGGIGGAVGYGAASSGSGGIGGSGGSSVLAGASTPGGATAAAPAATGSVEAVAQTVLPSVVQLRGASGEGSGIVISADGLILTNAHVLEAGQAQQQSSGLGGQLGGQRQQAGGLTAVFQNGTTAPVQVVGTDATADLAVVRAQDVSGLTPVQLGDSDQLRVGQEVVAVGSPLGLSGTVTTGIVSAMQRPVATGGAQSGQSSVIDAIQTDAAINPGNSGGALVDMQGRVVGITSAIASLGSSSSGQQSGSIGLGFAIPIDQAARIGQELTTSGSATQAVLGVQVGDATPTGATLGQLTPGGPAAAAGLAQGDVVTRMDDRVIDDADSLVAAIRSQQPGSAVTLTVASAGAAPRQVPVTLGTERAPSS